MERFNFAVKGRAFQTEDLTIGKIIDLWKMRSILSGGTYGQMYRIGMTNADEALMAIDIEAFFNIFCPELIKSLKPGSVRDMGLEDYMELREVYVKELLPWLDSVEAILKKKSETI